MRQHLIVNIRDSYISLTTLLTHLFGELSSISYVRHKQHTKFFRIRLESYDFINVGDEATQTIMFDNLLIFT